MEQSWKKVLGKGNHHVMTNSFTKFQVNISKDDSEN